MEQETTHADRPTVADAKARPWKYIGYRGFCKFVASDDDFFVLRRFSRLTTRVLLSLQDEICELESRLDRLEDGLYHKEAEHRNNGSFREETSVERFDLIHEVREKLRAYHELAIQHSNLRSRPEVPERNAESVTNWLENRRFPILEAEARYVNERKDLFAMAPKEISPLRRVLEKSRHFRFCGLWREEPEVDENACYEDDDTYYMSDKRIDLFVTGIITIVGLMLLITPLWILEFIQSRVDQLAVITSFSVLFLVFVSFTTVARPYETLGAAAAYAAVLVVFLQISS